jgi:hypothetical protein
VKKIFFVLASFTLIFVLLGASTSVFAASKKPKTCIVLYEKEGYKGRSIRICSNTPDLSKHKFNDKARSVKVEGKGSVTLYANKNYKGGKLDIKGNTKEDYVDPITSSIKFKS